MKYLLRQLKVVDPRSPFNGTVQDILLTSDGLIESIGTNLEASDAKEFTFDNGHLSLGWVDIRADFADPGHEDREDLSSGAAAALAGGFCAVALSPATSPIMDHKSKLRYWQQENHNTALNILPLAAATKDLKGQELTEHYDLQEGGAAGFSNGFKPISNSNVAKLALLYSRETGLPLHLYSYDEQLRRGGQMNEGEVSTWLGLKGIPALSEEVGLIRDIYLAEYTEAPLHLCGLSTAESLRQLEMAQQKNKRITADLNLMNLVFKDKDLESYDSNLKVYPPLRTEADQNALIGAVKSGLVQAIASQHQPCTIEEKRCEFDLARFGAATLEGFFGALWANLSSSMSLDELIPSLTIGPRQILGFEKEVKIAEGKKLSLTIFDPDKEWSWDEYKAKSKAANYPFKGRTMKGKALAVFSKGQLIKSDL
jgi:dihydroorotase